MSHADTGRDRAEAAPERAEATASPREPDARPADPPAAVGAAAGPALVEADLLVEDVSIDGMCGVY
jgi:mycofactocin precursor